MTEKRSGENVDFRSNLSPLNNNISIKIVSCECFLKRSFLLLLLCVWMTGQKLIPGIHLIWGTAFLLNVVDVTCFWLQVIHDSTWSAYLLNTKSAKNDILQGIKEMKSELYFCRYLGLVLNLNVKALNSYWWKKYIQKHPHYLFSTKSPRAHMHCSKRLIKTWYWVAFGT